MLWKAFRDKTNAARAKFKLPPRKTVWTKQPMVYGVSPNLLPTPADWPANVHLCGQWLAPSPAWMPPPPLANFLAAGEAPIYIGFGSMTGFDNARLLDALVEGMNGRRALFHPGWSGIDPKGLPDNFLAIGDTPHDWLFPRTAAVIHHGGSGTSHSAARAGVPSIVTPFAGDQFFWAERLRLAGVAPAAVDGRRPTAKAFAGALESAATARVRNRARAVRRCARRTASWMRWQPSSASWQVDASARARTPDSPPRNRPKRSSTAVPSETVNARGCSPGERMGRL
jgi:UDP:flavonoid glycosyltransferase YjiC (YdhE family)